MSDPMQSPYRADSSSSSSGPPNLEVYSKEQLYNFIQAAEQRAAQSARELTQLQLHSQLQAAAPPVAVVAAAPAASDPLALAIGRALAAASTLQPLPLFDGAGNASGVAAYSWLQQVELAFEARAQAVGADIGDRECIGAASSALRGGAQTWYSSLAKRPGTWSDFKKLLLDRFQPASAHRLIERQLRLFVAGALKVGERFTTKGLENYTAQFTLLAGQLPAAALPELQKIKLYADALPTRLRELVYQEEDRALEDGKTMELNAIVNKILRRSAARETAAGPGSAHSSDAMDISALEQCAQTFGISAIDAAAYLEPSEGWASYETSGQRAAASSPSSGHQSSVHVLSQAANEQRMHALEMQLAALGRRSVAPPVKRDVPDPLAAERKAAGLCIRCGVAKYEAGGRGHNSRTCQAPVDKTTGVAAGAKKAGLGAPLFQ
jgi:hypothetical protein